MKIIKQNLTESPYSRNIESDHYNSTKSPQPSEAMQIYSPIGKLESPQTAQYF